MFFGIVDRICAWLIYVESFALPIMLMYYISSFQTANWIIGFIVGAIFAWWFQGKLLQQSRIWIYSTTIALSIMTVTIIFMLSHNL